MEKKHRVSIENFGPISCIENMSIDDVLIFLGEQATGKSTIAKLIFFARSTRDELLDFIFSSEKIKEEQYRDAIKDFTQLLKRKFINVFGKSWDRDDFKVVYYYTENSQLIIEKNRNDSEYFFSVSLSSKLFSDIYSLFKIFKKKYKTRSDYATDLSFIIDYSKNLEISYMENVRKQLYTIFNDEYRLFYIPAGRSLLSHPNINSMLEEREINLFTEQKYSIYETVDALTRKFIKDISGMRSIFVNDIHGLWENLNIINQDSMSISHYFDKYVEYYTKILKGVYRYENDKEYIVIDSNSLIPLSYASSGQQEAVWILNALIFYMMLKGKSFIVIEEPEAHLYPESQGDLVKALSIFSNTRDNQLIITTHSPYIIMSINNLLFAAKRSMATDAISEIEHIIPKVCWLNNEDVSAYILKDGIASSIKDNYLHLIDISELDKIASIIDDEYESMLNI